MTIGHTDHAILCIFGKYQSLMRVFVHLIAFPPQILHRYLPLKGCQTERINGYLTCVFLNGSQPEQDLHGRICSQMGLEGSQVLIKIALLNKNAEHWVRMPAGMRLQILLEQLGSQQNCLMRHQLQVSIQNLSSSPGAKSSASEMEAHKEENMSEIQGMSGQLFKALRVEDTYTLTSLIKPLRLQRQRQKVKTLLNMYDFQTGQTLLIRAIALEKHQFLQHLLIKYSEYMEVNKRSVDGWLPFQLAVANRNKTALDLLTKQAQIIGLNLDYKSPRGLSIFNLIDTADPQLMFMVVQRVGIQFELHLPGTTINAYTYLAHHKGYTQGQKKALLQRMHLKHLQYFDTYRLDKLLHLSGKKYHPEIPHRTHSPTRKIRPNNNLRIVSGQIIKCRTPPHFAKVIYLSINSYIGAVEEYEVDSKLKKLTDIEKLDKYKKTYHYSIEEIEEVRMLQQAERSWYMKKDLAYFMFKQKRGHKTILACHHQRVANQWISEIKQAKHAWQRHPHQEHPTHPTHCSIVDTPVEEKAPEVKKIQEHQCMDLFTKRFSMVQTGTDNSQEDDVVTKSKSQYNKTTVSSSAINEEGDKLHYKDFKMLQLLGEGSFGQVFLVRCKLNGRYYALKTFQKKRIILGKQTRFVVAQVNILKQVESPFVVSLHFTFQTPHFIYLGLQYCPGKDLSRHLAEEGVFSEADTRIYMAEILLALECLHKLGIIYRDLKPQNVMVGADGHILLVDFGLSKKTQNNVAKTFCGSPAYLSPQMLERRGVGPATDYFSLGVVMYELLLGEPPFYSDNIHLLYDNIMHADPVLPSNLPGPTRAILFGLLQKDPKQRLGTGSVDEIKKHDYFKGLNWESVLKKEVKVPKRNMGVESDIESEEQLINMFHDDQDYTEDNYKVNRFKHFSFVREKEFQ